MIKFFRTVQYFIKMSLVALWCSVVSIIYYFLTFPFNRKKWLSWAFARTLHFGVRLSTGIKVIVQGRENMIPGPAVVIMNHQSNFDPLLQGPVFPKNTVIIGKIEIVKIPLWGRIFNATNNILVDRNSKGKSSSAIDLAVERLQNDDCYLWVFPEGTRSQGGKMKRFKHGAFKMAIATQAPIIPMVTTPLQPVLDVPNKVAKGGKLGISILEPISTKGMTESDLPALILNCEEIYKRELSKHLNVSTDDVFETH
jgi:1-acyl-sn-glycerol-3-phosphate acyltransferase